MILRRSGCIAFVLLATGSVVLPRSAVLAADIIPRPAKETPIAATGFILSETARIIVPLDDNAAAKAGEYLSAKLAQTLRRNVPILIGAPSQAGDITIASDAAAPADGEAYSLKVAGGVIRVTARSDAGLFYGAVSAWDLLTAQGNNSPVPAVAIEDAPRFAWRGIMLDSSRHMQSVEYIKQLIDVMALHKFNRLHWHLTDDQGWRIEISQYPRLTSVGAWRKAVGPDVRDPRTNAKGMYGGYYTQAQIRDIVAYAAIRHVVIVPEVDLPGHATALLAAYPRLGVPEFKPEPVASDWGLLPEVVNVDPATLKTLEDILDKVMDLFPGEYIHLGGDEADKAQWRGSPSVQARMKALGIKDEDALERWFISQLGKHVTARGRTLIGWDEIQEGENPSDLAKDTVVMTWHAGPAARKALDGGHRVVMAQAPTYYLNNRQQNTADEPPGWTDIISTERIYKNNPMPPGVSDEAAARVFGVQAQIWTERVRKEEWATRLLFPRASAVAEVAWTPANRLDWDDFRQRMVAQQRRYAELGMGSTGPISSAPAATKSPTLRTSLQLDFCDGNATGLVVEGPHNETERLRVFNRKPCWIWRKADLSSIKSVSLRAAKLPFNYRLGNKAPIASRPTPHSAGGEIELHRDSADGPILATMLLSDFGQTKEHQFLAPIAAATGLHDLYVVVTGEPIDSRKPLTQRPELVALDWIELR